MTVADLVHRLDVLPDGVARAELAVLHANDAVTAAKEGLADETAALRLARNDEGFPIISGKNAEERDAQLRMMTSGLRMQLIEAERELDKAQLDLHRLQNEHASLKSIARVIGRERD